MENLLITAKEFSRSRIHNHTYTDLESGLEVAKKVEAGNHFMLFFSVTGKMFVICRDIASVPTNIKVLMTCLKFDLQANSDKSSIGDFFLRLVSQKNSPLDDLRILLNKKNYSITDYTTLDSNEILELLVKITDANLEKAQRMKNTSFAKYVLTVGSLINMTLIYSRYISNIPIVFMGEAGSGKTYLVKFFVEIVLQEVFMRLPVTAGTDLIDVTDFLSRAIAAAGKLENRRVWMFFDEFNRSDCNTHISQIIYEKKFEGKLLPENITIIASCNAVSMRMPEKIMEYVWDFGSLNKKDFVLYAHSMISQLRLDGEKNSKIVMLIEFANDYFKYSDVGRSVGLRDVSRYIELYKWFNNIRTWIREGLDMKAMHYDIRSPKVGDEIKCLILAFWHCYSLRISSKSERGLVLDRLSRIVKINTIEILGIISEEQHIYMISLWFEEENAEYEALQNDIFAILPCIMNKIPIFIDAQAFNKVLAVRYLLSILIADKSRNKFLSRLPGVKIFEQNCGSSIEVIEEIFEKAESCYEETEISNKYILPIIFIEGIEGSGFLTSSSLKAFHRYLDDGNKKFAFIAVTNCKPNNSIMSHAIYLKDSDS